MTGTTVSHYRIIEKLGAGGMGEVYKAEDTKLKRKVALKFLTTDLSKTSKARERFLREARAAAALNHPNLCSIYEIDMVDGRPFIAMAYIEGGTLSEIIDTGPPLSIDQILDICLQVAEGLEESHDNGIVHRDIKSGNIIVTPKGHAKIMDFGLAKLAGESKITKPNAVMGSSNYMSPEQALGQETDLRTDIWSLGVVLYEMLTGTLPFRGENDPAIINSILNDEPEPLCSEEFSIPPELERILHKMLQKKADDRYGDMGVLIKDLNSINPASGFGTMSAQSMSAMTEDMEFQTRERILAISTAVLACLCLSLILLILKPDSDRAGESASSRDSTATSTKRNPLPSIGVMPFINLSSDEDQTYFCDGLSEEIINELARQEGLHVVARTSAFSLREKRMDVREIGEKLGVNTVMEGSVQKSGDKLRVTAQLVDVSTGYQLWSKIYTLQEEDIFKLHDKIILAILESLKPELMAGERRRLRRRLPAGEEAYRLYMKGRWFWNSRNPGSLVKAREFFEQAIEKEPGYAEPYAGLAYLYIVLPFYSNLSPEELYPKAEEAALKALELDDTLSDAHAALGFARMINHWDWEGAEQEFKRALELNPGCVISHQWYSLYLRILGRFDESEKELERALFYDPFSLNLRRNMVQLLYYTGRYDQLEKTSEDALDVDPNLRYIHMLHGGSHLQKSEWKESLEELEKEKAIAKVWDPYVEALIGTTYARMGRKSEAAEILKKMMEKSSEQYCPPYFLAILNFSLGEKDKGFEWLEKAYEIRDQWMVLNFKIDPLLDDIRPDPKYAALVSKMGLNN